MSPGPSTRGRRQHCGARSSKAIVILRSPRGDCIALQNHSRLHSRDNLQEILAELPEFWQNSAELPEFWFQITSCSSPEGYRFGIPQCHQIIRLCFINLDDPIPSQNPANRAASPEFNRILVILQNSGNSARILAAYEILWDGSGKHCNLRAE